jgi:hypothetical protein
MLNGSAESAVAQFVAQVKHTARQELRHEKATHAHRRLTPTQAINAAYAAFTTAFNNVLNSYVQSINEESGNQTAVPVQAMVTAAYTPPGTFIQVNNAAVFGTEGTYPTPLAANAFIGSVKVGSFSFSGSSGNLLLINPAMPGTVSLPVGAVLTANVPVSAQSSAAAIFPSYIVDSTIQMAIGLVKYFNNLPIKLPPENAPPHTPVQRGAIQTFVYESIAASSATSLYQYTNGSVPASLQQLLLAIPLPTTQSADLQIYQASVASAIAESHQEVLDGVTQVFNRRLLVSAQPPANRLGENFNSSTASGSSGTTSSTSSSSSGSSSSTA